MTVHPFARPGLPAGTAATRAVAATRCAACAMRGAGLCAWLDDAALGGLSRRARWVRFGPDEEVLPQDEATDRVGLLVEGQVKIVHRTAEGAEQLLGLLSPGDVVGRAFEAALPTAFETATEAVVCLIPRPDFEAALERQPALQQGYLRSVLDALDRERLWAAALRGRSAIERLAGWLEERVGAAAPGARDRAVVEIDLRRRDVAALLDMTPETFSRALHQIADRRVVRLLSPSRIEVVSRAGLAAMAGPGAEG